MGRRRLTKQQVPKPRNPLISELVHGYGDFTKKLAQNRIYAGKIQSI